MSTLGPPGHGAQMASPFLLIVFGVVFATIGAARIYLRVLDNRRDSSSLLKGSLSEPPPRRFGPVEPIGVGFMIVGIFVAILGLVRGVK